MAAEELEGRQGGYPEFLIQIGVVYDPLAKNPPSIWYSVLAARFNAGELLINRKKSKKDTTLKDGYHFFVITKRLLDRKSVV